MKGDRRSERFGYVGPEQENSGKVVRDAFGELGWERIFGPGWDVLWYIGMDPPREVYSELASHQRINHIPGVEVLCRKPLLAETLNSYLGSFAPSPGETRPRQFFPDTYVLPQPAEVLDSLFAGPANARWILKPQHASWGRDVRLVTGIEDVPNRDHWMLQRYIDNPLLIDGRKFNLRLFLLITCIDPLEAYVYRDGFVDLAVQPYNDAPEAIGIVEMHNTNAGVQRPEWHLRFSQWREILEQEGRDADHVWKTLVATLRHTVLSAGDALTRTNRRLINYRNNGFELLGVDLVLDDKWNPWLLECNRSPSMGTTLSGKFKLGMVKDLISLVATEQPQLDINNGFLRLVD